VVIDRWLGGDNSSASEAGEERPSGPTLGLPTVSFQTRNWGREEQASDKGKKNRERQSRTAARLDNEGGGIS